MEIKAWPFLVSRNRNLDYRPIVAPQPFVEKGATLLVTEAVGGDFTQPGHAIYREIHGSSIGDATLIFRVLPAEQSYIGIQEGGLLHDEFGRAIHLIEGIVLEGLIPHVLITEKDFQLIHEYLMQLYKEFWEVTERTVPAKPSSSFLLHSENAANDLLVLHKEPPFHTVRSSDRTLSPVPEEPDSREDQSHRNLHVSRREVASSIPQTAERKKGLQPIIILISVSLLLVIAAIIFFYLLSGHH